MYLICTDVSSNDVKNVFYDETQNSVNEDNNLNKLFLSFLPKLKIKFFPDGPHAHTFCCIFNHL